MRKLLLLFLLVANLPSYVLAQRMYREAGENCKIDNLWYKVSDLCDSEELSPLRCDYCGLYFPTLTEKNAHQLGCRHKPHIEYQYDEAGNRVKRVIENYRLGRKVTAYNQDTPSREGFDAPESVAGIAFTKRKDDEEFENFKRKENIV
jgi:hypothetical protein